MSTHSHRRKTQLYRYVHQDVQQILSVVLPLSLQNHSQFPHKLWTLGPTGLEAPVKDVGPRVL